MTTFYFDASDAAATDPQAVWTNDANAFEGSTATTASCATAGDTSTNYLIGEGTNGYDLIGSILGVNARMNANGSLVTVSAAVYTDALGELLGTATVSGTNGWGSWITLSTPSGGWTNAKIQALEVKMYVGGDAGTVSRVEIEVSQHSIPGRIYRAQGFQ